MARGRMGGQHLTKTFEKKPLYTHKTFTDIIEEHHLLKAFHPAQPDRWLGGDAQELKAVQAQPPNARFSNG